MAMSRRIIRTLVPRSTVLSFSRRFSAGSVLSDADIGHHKESNRTYRVGVKLPEEKWSDSKEEKDDWYHWFLASSSLRGGSKAAVAPIKRYRDPRILWTYPCGFCARLSVQDIESLSKRDEFMYSVPDLKADIERQKNCEISGSQKNFSC